jgi:hypothetical protein
MLTVLGVLGILVFCFCVIAFAAGATWIVVKLTPSRTSKPSTPAEGEP